jgi:hypothetical protein
MRTVIATGLGCIAPTLMASLGAWLGASAGFHVVGLPSGEHCGLAVLPAVAAGGLGGILGFAGGLILGVFLAGMLLGAAALAKGNCEGHFVEGKEGW